MRGMIFAAVGLVLLVSAHAASTNLNYTVSEINSALGYALDNATTPDRCTVMESTVLEMEISVSNMAASVSAYTNQSSSASAAQVVFNPILVADDFSTASVSNYTTIDLSGWIGANPALVFLLVEQEGAVQGAEFRVRHPSVTNQVCGGVGMVVFEDVTPSKKGLVVCSADSNGHIAASSPEAVDLDLMAFIREVQP